VSAPDAPAPPPPQAAPAPAAAGREGLRFDVITLFPELFGPHLECGITRRAFADGAVRVVLWPLRDHAEGTYRRVDDRPFGGGPGMVLLAEPLLRALDAVAEARGVPAPVVHFTPGGRRLDQALVREFAAGPGAVLLCGRYEGVDAVLLCGRYEGVDQRVVERRVTHEISLGDFVLSGGELPALVLLDAVARLQPGVLAEGSASEDSVGPPRTHRPLAARARARAECAPAPRPDRRRARRGAPRPAGRAVPGRPRAIMEGFRSSAGPPRQRKARVTIARRLPWT